MATVKKKSVNVRTTSKKSLQKSKKLTRVHALLIILVVALAGTYFVYRSFAGSYAFGRTPKQMSGGTLRQSGGVYRKNLNGQMDVVKAYASFGEIQQTRQVCTTVVFNQKTTGNVTVREYSNSNRYDVAVKSGTFKSGQRVQICGGVYRANNQVSIEVDWHPNANVSSAHSIGVLSIYGLK